MLGEERAAMTSRFVGGVLGLIVGVGVASASSAAGVPFKVIVNPSVAGRTVSRTVLAQVYLGAVERWGDGSAIAAVDLSGTSPVRLSFSEQVLGKSLDAVKFNWLRRIAAGQRPPLTKASDEDVIAFVASQRGGVGYVSAEASLPATVHEVTVQ
jgi:ABC-type phosphate transport system substrate-binding protein